MEDAYINICIKERRCGTKAMGKRRKKGKESRQRDLPHSFYGNEGSKKLLRKFPLPFSPSRGKLKSNSLISLRVDDLLIRI